MTKLLFYDTECNSLDKKHGFIQELGWALFELETKRLIHCKSDLVKWNVGYQVEPGALAATGLTREMSESMGRPARLVFEDFLLVCREADYLIGHNIVEFDNEMAFSNMKRCLFAEPTPFLNLKIIDTMLDLPLPKGPMALKYLAFDHGHILNDAHQALADVMASAHVFFKYPFEEIKKIVSTPIISLKTFTPYKLAQETKTKLYEMKFKWNFENKCYERQRFREFYLPKILEACPELDFYKDGKIIPRPRVGDQMEIPF